MPTMGGRVFDAAVWRLQVHVDDPLVQHLPERAHQYDCVAGGIVLITLEDIAEGGSRSSMHQIVIHRALKAFELSLVPRNEDFRVLDIGADLETGTFEVAGVELGWVIHDHEFRHAIAFPRVLDGRKLARDICLWKDRVFKAPHHRQATWRFKARVEAHWTTCMFIERRGDRGSPERQHRGVIHDDHVAGRVIHRHPLERAAGFGTAARYAKLHFGAAFPIARHHQFVWRGPFTISLDGPSARHWE